MIAWAAMPPRSASGRQQDSAGRSHGARQEAIEVASPVRATVVGLRGTPAAVVDDVLEPAADVAGSQDVHQGFSHGTRHESEPAPREVHALDAVDGGAPFGGSHAQRPRVV